MQFNFIMNTDAEIEIFLTSYINTMAPNALAPCVARSSAALILILQD